MICQATLKNLHKMLYFIDTEAEAAGFGADEIYQIRLASEEALVNVMNYAYPQKKKGKVDIHCERYSRRRKGMCIVIEDQGIEFNPLEIEMETLEQQKLSLEEREVGGLGIFYILKVMDEVSYKRKEGRNILTLIKYLA